MKRLICIICCLVCAFGVQAAVPKADSTVKSEYGQTYVADNLHADSVKLAENLKIPNGERLVLVGKNDENRPLFEYNGKRYEVYPIDLKFVAPNADGVGNTIQSNEQIRYHSALGHFFNSYMPLFIILVLLLFSGAAMFLASKARGVAAARPWLIAVPLSLLAVSVLETVLMIYCDDITWWCDYDKVGFWKSMLYMLPLVAAVALQLGVGYFYKNLLEDMGDCELSWKSVFFCILWLPIAVIIMVIAAIMGFKDSVMQDIVLLILILGGMALFLLYAWRKNSKGLGASMGLIFTFFSLVYAIGACIATIALLIVLWKLFLVIITYIFMAAAFIFVVAFLGGSSSSGGGNRQMVFLDKDGKKHISGYDRDEANKKIDER